MNYLQINQNLDQRKILFIDDSENNLTAARSAGLNVIQYKNLPRLINDFSKLKV